MVPDAVFIAAVGASTPVGRNAWSSAAAVRAGISGFAEHPYMIDSAGVPMRVALAPWLDIGCPSADRFEALLLPAIGQALAPLEGSAGELKLALVLALPASRPGLPEDLELRLRAAVLTRWPNTFVAIATFAVGHAAGILGLRAAYRKIADRSFDACVVAGVESYLTGATLEWLESNDQLHGAGPLNNAWGFVPGEAAGAVLAVSADATVRRRIDALAQVLSIGTAVEENRIKTRTVCIGEGLTSAFRAGLAGLPAGSHVTDVFCDMNGEPYRADEFGFACMRTRDAFACASDFMAPADCWGDVSAASAPLSFALAAIAHQKRYANGPYAFVWASSEGGERGAALLAMPSNGN